MPGTAIRGRGLCATEEPIVDLTRGGLDGGTRLGGKRGLWCDDNRCVRMDICVSRETDNKIASLARWLEGDPTDVLKTAVALLDLAVRSRKEGNLVCITDKNYKVIMELSGI